jgi:hypothetical protein
MVNSMWLTFTEKHSQLRILHIPSCFLSVALLQITLEYLPLLESLEVRVRGFNYGFLYDFADLSDLKSLDRYKKERAEKAANLIGENYDRFEHLKLDFAYGSSLIKTIIENHLKKYYPGVKLYK